MGGDDSHNYDSCIKCLEKTIATVEGSSSVVFLFSLTPLDSFYILLKAS